MQTFRIVVSALSFGAMVTTLIAGEWDKSLHWFLIGLLWALLAARELEIADVKRQLGPALYDDARLRGKSRRT